MRTSGIRLRLAFRCDETPACSAFPETWEGSWLTWPRPQAHIAPARRKGKPVLLLTGSGATPSHRKREPTPRSPQLPGSGPCHTGGDISSVRGRRSREPSRFCRAHLCPAQCRRGWGLAHGGGKAVSPGSGSASRPGVSRSSARFVAETEKALLHLKLQTRASGS